MADVRPYTKHSYRYLLLNHFGFCILLSICIVCGFHFSGSELGTSKTPYFTTAMVLIGVNLPCIFCCLFVVINTRNNRVFTKKEIQINKLMVWYNLVLNVGTMYCFIGIFISFALGCCKGDECYAQTNVEINIAIGAINGALHILCFIYFVIISGKVRGLHPQTKTQTKSEPIKRIQVKCNTDSTDSDDDKKMEKDNTIVALENVRIKAIDAPGKSPFAVFSKSIVLFMADKKRSKEVSPHTPKIETSNIFKQDGLRDYQPTSNEEHL